MKLLLIIAITYATIGVAVFGYGMAMYDGDGRFGRRSWRAIGYSEGGIAIKSILWLPYLLLFPFWLIYRGVYNYTKKRGRLI